MSICVKPYKTVHQFSECFPTAGKAEYMFQKAVLQFSRKITTTDPNQRANQGTEEQFRNGIFWGLWVRQRSSIKLTVETSVDIQTVALKIEQTNTSTYFAIDLAHNEVHFRKFLFHNVLSTMNTKRTGKVEFKMQAFALLRDGSCICSQSWPTCLTTRSRVEDQAHRKASKVPTKRQKCVHSDPTFPADFYIPWVEVGPVLPPEEMLAEVDTPHLGFV
jgi:hypothetical protein